MSITLNLLEGQTSPMVQKGDYRFGTVVETGRVGFIVRGMGTKTVSCGVNKAGAVNATDMGRIAKAFNLEWSGLRETYRGGRILAAAMAMARSMGAKVSTEKEIEKVRTNTDLMLSVTRITADYASIEIDDLPSVVAFLASKGRASSSGSTLSQIQDNLMVRGYDVETPLDYSGKKGAEKKASMLVQIGISTQLLFAGDPSWSAGDKLRDNKVIQRLNALAVEISKEVKAVHSKAQNDK